MFSHKVNEISFDNMTCLMIMKIFKISSHMKGHRQAQKRSCPQVVSFHIHCGDAIKRIYCITEMILTFDIKI